MAGDAPIAVNATIALDIADVTCMSMERTGFPFHARATETLFSAALIGNA